MRTRDNLHSQVLCASDGALLTPRGRVARALVLHEQVRDVEHEFLRLVIGLHLLLSVRGQLLLLLFDYLIGEKTARLTEQLTIHRRPVKQEKILLVSTISNS